MLSRRERQVAHLLVRGLTSKEMADALGLSIHTINQYIRTIYVKLDVNTRGACVARLMVDHMAPAAAWPSLVLLDPV